jgi:predicted transcriptional regulator
MKTRVLTVHVPAERVEKYAKSTGRSRDWVIEPALARWVSWEEEKNRLTLEAIAEVDAGHFIEHADMVAWAESLGSDDPLPRPVPRTREER